MNRRKNTILILFIASVYFSGVYAAEETKTLWDYNWIAGKENSNNMLKVYGKGQFKPGKTSKGNICYENNAVNGMDGTYWLTSPAAWKDCNRIIEFKLTVKGSRPGYKKITGVIINSPLAEKKCGFEWYRRKNVDTIAAVENPGACVPFANFGKPFTYRIVYHAKSGMADLYYLDEVKNHWSFLITSTGMHKSKSDLTAGMMLGNYSRNMAGCFQIEFLRWADNRLKSGLPMLGNKENLGSFDSQTLVCAAPLYAAQGQVPLRIQLKEPVPPSVSLYLQISNLDKKWQKEQCIAVEGKIFTVKADLIECPPGRISIGIKLVSSKLKQALASWNGDIFLYRKQYSTFDGLKKLEPDQTLILRDMPSLAESQPGELRTTPYTTLTGEKGIIAAPTNPLGMGFIVNFPLHGRYVMLAGVALGTNEVSVQFGFSKPEIWRKIQWNPSVPSNTFLEVYLGLFDSAAAETRLRVGLRNGGSLGYLRFVPYTEPGWPHSLLKGNRRVLVDNDGFSVFYMGMFGTPQAMRRYMEKYRGTDIQGLIWCVGNPLEVGFKSKYAPIFFEGCKQFPRPGDQRVYQAITRFLADGQSPLDTAIKICRENKLMCLASLRMNRGPNVIYDQNRSFPVYEKFKKSRVITGHGTNSNISYGNPEYRTHILNLLREISTHNPDGVLLDFTRCPPYIGFYPTLVAEFRKKYKLPDNAAINPKDPRWLKMKAAPITDLLRRTRKMLDKQSKGFTRQKLAVHIYQDQRYLGSGLDIRTWIDEKLVDIIVIASQHEFTSLAPWKLPDFIARAKQNGIVVYAHIDSHFGGHDPTPEEAKALERGEKIVREAKNVQAEYYKKRAYELYSQGTDGVYIWDGFYNLGSITRLGDRDKLYLWQRWTNPSENQSEMFFTQNKK
jgi:hypothetical protein